MLGYTNPKHHDQATCVEVVAHDAWELQWTCGARVHLKS
jgi:hypothetical protein